MSKRHQVSRRRSYGRRQHEVRERPEQALDVVAGEFGRRAEEHGRNAFSFLDLDLGRRQFSFAAGD